MSGEIERLEARAEALVAEHEALLHRLVEMRHGHNLTQAAVAERMGVTQPTVASFERYDANPTLSSLRRYAMAVGARIEHKIIDDCVDHNGQVFEAITRNMSPTVWQHRAPESDVPWKTVVLGRPW